MGCPDVGLEVIQIFKTECDVESDGRSIQIFKTKMAEYPLMFSDLFALIYFVRYGQILVGKSAKKAIYIEYMPTVTSSY